MEWKVQDRVFDRFIVVVDFLEVMKSSFLDEIVSFDSLHCIEMGYLQGKNIQIGMFKHEPVLWLDASSVCIEESQELPIWSLRVISFFLLRIFITGIFLILFGLFGLRHITFWCFDLYTKVPDFLLIPRDSNGNMIFSKVVIDERVSVNIVDMETMIDWWAWSWCTVGNDTYFTSVGIYGAASNMTYKCFWVLESTRLSDLFDLTSNGEDSNVWLLSPADDELTHDLKTAHFAFALREH